MESLHTRVAALILLNVPKLMGALASDLRKAMRNLSPGHFAVLLLLAGGERHLSALAAELAVSLPTTSKTISTLSERGWVICRRDPSDHRRLLVSLSPAGGAALEEIRASAMGKIERSIAPLSTEQCLQVINGLETLSSILDEGTAGHGKLLPAAPTASTELCTVEDT